MIELFYKNGVPKSALKLIQGDGSIGSKLISFDHISGVAFTGSSATAKKIYIWEGLMFMIFYALFVIKIIGL